MSRDVRKGPPSQRRGNDGEQRRYGAKKPISPGKVTRTSKLAPAAGPPVQLQKTPGKKTAGVAPRANSAWRWTNDPNMDAAVRGVVAPEVGAQNPPVQLKAVDTGYGTFTDEAYTDIELSHNKKKVGVDMHLSFKPNDKVDASKIGMMQAVKSYNEGTPELMNEADKDRTVQGGDADGYQIDRAHGNNNPVYGSELAAAGQSLADTPETNAPTGTEPDVSKGGNATYVLGHRVKKDAKDWDQKKAEMHDAPQLGYRGANAGQEFETTALALDGAQKDTYYGSVRWGWQTDGKGAFTKIELSKVSDATPSENFLEAAKVWNKHVFSPRIAKPKADGSTQTTANLTVSKGGKSFTVAAGTKLSVDLASTPVGNDMLVTLADAILLKDGGVFFMDWVEQGALDGDTMKADTEMEFQGKKVTVAAGAKVKRTGSVVGTRELATIMDGVVSNLDFAHRLVWAEIIDMKGGETVDLPGAE